jgi:hypothetical protein
MGILAVCWPDGVTASVFSLLAGQKKHRAGEQQVEAKMEGCFCLEQVRWIECAENIASMLLFWGVSGHAVWLRVTRPAWLELGRRDGAVKCC